MNRAVLIATLAIATSLILGSAATSTAAASGPPSGLTETGRVLWNFEGLLTRTFGQADNVGVKTLDYSADFVGWNDSGCDMASCQDFSFSFAPHSSTAFHLAAVRPSGSFGNYPVLVRVQGDYVACNAAGTEFLIAYGDTMNFGLDCLKPEG